MIAIICPVCEKTEELTTQTDEQGYKVKVCLDCYLVLEAERIALWKKRTASAKTQTLR